MLGQPALEEDDKGQVKPERIGVSWEIRANSCVLAKGRAAAS